MSVQVVRASDQECVLGISLCRFFGHISMRGDPGEEPELSGGTIFTYMDGNAIKVKYKRFRWNRKCVALLLCQVFLKLSKN